MSSNIDITFIVPVFNKKINEVKTCLKSLCSERIVSEILLIDDGSDAELGKTYEKLAQNTGAVYLYKENGGVGSARNYGIKRARGNYISFVDADDELQINNILVSDFKKSEDIIFYNVEKLIGNSGKKKLYKFDFSSGSINLDDILKYSLDEGLISWSVAKFYRKNFLLRKSLFFDENMKLSEDLDFMIRVISSEPSMYYDDRVMYIYNYSTSTGQEREKKYPLTVLNDFKKSYNIRQSILHRVKIAPNEKKQYEDSMRKNNVKNIIRIYSNWLNYDSRRAKQLINPFICAVKEYTDGYKLDIITKIRVYMIENKKFTLLYGYYYLKKFYHFLKKDPLD